MPHKRSREAIVRRLVKKISRDKIRETSFFCRITKETVCQTSRLELFSQVAKEVSAEIKVSWIRDVEHGEVLKVSANSSYARCL